MKDQNYTDRISSLLPDSFEFYDFGRVENQGELSREKNEIHNEVVGVAFSIFPDGIGLEGDFGGRKILICTFDSGLDASMYIEVGNILASRFATRLGEAASEGMMITPPQFLQAAAVRRMISLEEKVVLRTRYVHTYNQTLIPI